MKLGKVKMCYCILLGMLLSVCQVFAYTDQLTQQSDARTAKHTYVIKKYNLFFPIDSYDIEENFRDNAHTIETIRKDMEATLGVVGALPDSLLILATASPDGSYAYNKSLAQKRAASTEAFILKMFPALKDAHIEANYLEEDWDGLRQVLKVTPDFPQRDQMLAIIESNDGDQSKESGLRALKAGWNYLVRHHIYALRNSSITISVIMTSDNADDEYVVSIEQNTDLGPVEEPAQVDNSDVDTVQPVQEPLLHFEQPVSPLPDEQLLMKYRKTIMAARSNLLMPGMNIGLEFPIKGNWSIGFNYSYPWAVSANNKWCVEKLSWFADVRYWFTNENTAWTTDSRLKGHSVGLYGGLGYYDFQNKIQGKQGEFINFGVEYTYALPVANDKLRLEFNLGLGFLNTWYRPYTPASDYSDLIKEPGVKYRSTNFVGPTRVGVSLVWPVTVNVKKKGGSHE